jgi:hypothetical protein
MFRTRRFIFRKTVLSAVTNLSTAHTFPLQDYLYRWQVNRLYYTCTYIRLLEYKTPGSKHVEDIVKIKRLV